MNEIMNEPILVKHILIITGVFFSPFLLTGIYIILKALYIYKISLYFKNKNKAKEEMPDVIDASLREVIKNQRNTY